MTSHNIDSSSEKSSLALDSAFHPKGRPRKHEESTIRNILFQHFTVPTDLKTISDLTGYNIKTVRRYHKEFLKINLGEQKDHSKEWGERKKVSQLQMTQQYTKLLNLQENLESDINGHRDNGKEIPRWIYAESRRIAESISKIVLAMTNLGLSPTADEMLKLSEVVHNAV